NGSQDVSYVFTDHQGGLQIVWVGATGSVEGATVYHMAPDGSPYPGWPACGIMAVESYVRSDPCCGVLERRYIALGAPIWPDGAFVKSITDYWRTDCHFPDCVSDHNGCCANFVFQGPGS